MSVNVKSVFHSVAACVPLLIEQGRGGSIINIASVGAARPRSGLVYYNASKAAVDNVRAHPSGTGRLMRRELCTSSADDVST
jgi:NAD(P)-dependent dehydrogenase (short-subunit alcohol dehydrogenase family)